MMKISGRQIGGDKPPYIVAEISGNHAGSLENAKNLIKAAKEAGADAVKTQCYKPDTITLDCTKPDFIVQNGLWQGRTLYELYQSAHTPFEWHKELFKTAKEVGIVIFSSVFDFTSIDYLENIDCPAYKIASFEIVDLPLIEHATKTKKPIIISTGMASDQEILEAFDASGRSAALLHCTSEYPGTVANADMGRIGHLDTLTGYDTEIGISDHTNGIIVPVIATALRASIIEKHIKLDGVKSEDSEFSLDPEDFQTMVAAVHVTHESLKENPIKSNPSRQMRRSIYAVRDIAEGEIFTTQNVRSIRPGYGLPPKMLPRLFGKQAKKRFRKGDPIRI